MLGLHIERNIHTDIGIDLCIRRTTIDRNDVVWVITPSACRGIHRGLYSSASRTYPITIVRIGRRGEIDAEISVSVVGPTICINAVCASCIALHGVSGASNISAIRICPAIRPGAIVRCLACVQYVNINLRSRTSTDIIVVITIPIICLATNLYTSIRVNGGLVNDPIGLIEINVVRFTPYGRPECRRVFTIRRRGFQIHPHLRP